MSGWQTIDNAPKDGTFRPDELDVYEALALAAGEIKTSANGIRYIAECRLPSRHGAVFAARARKAIRSASEALDTYEATR